MNHLERITLLVKLDLKHQWNAQVYVIKAMHIYFLKEL